MVTSSPPSVWGCKENSKDMEGTPSSADGVTLCPASLGAIMKLRREKQ